jgi:hypothetical protein
VLGFRVATVDLAGPDAQSVAADPEVRTEPVGRVTIFQNASTVFQFQPAEKFVAEYHQKMYDQEEQLLDVRCARTLVDLR